MKQYLTLDGLIGYALSMVGLVVTAAILWTIAIGIQQDQAENFYSIDTNINSLKANGKNQERYYKLEGK